MTGGRDRPGEPVTAGDDEGTADEEQATTGEGAMTDRGGHDDGAATGHGDLRRRTRYGGAAVIALGGAACAVVGGLLGGLGAGTAVTPASIHSIVDGRPAAGADLPSGFPALATTPLGQTSLVGDRMPLTVVPTPLAAVVGPPVGSGPSVPAVVATEPTTTTTTTTTAPPSSTSAPPRSSSGAPAPPPPVSGPGGIVTTVGGTVQHVVSELTSGLPGAPTSGSTPSGATGGCSGGNVVSGATSTIGSLPVAGGATSPGPSTG